MSEIKFYKYSESTSGHNILKDGHTMFNFDIVNDLNRKSHLEELTTNQQAEIAQLKAELKLAKENHALSSARCSKEMLNLAELHNGVIAQVNVAKEVLADLEADGIYGPYALGEDLYNKFKDAFNEP